tara:strand:+ start:539 stop:1540 length:1002 start_codon:yes stop_codon:yes gene_type:complete
MGMQKVEFDFPDPDKEEFKLEVEGRESEKVEVVVEEEKPVKQKAETAEVEIEVVDDTPKKDRNRKPSDPPEDITDDELEDYSEKVRKRLQHFSKGYHDERRAKETAFREKEEALRIAQQLVEENKTLKGTVGKNQEVLLDQAKRATNAEVEQAKLRYKQAYESGDSDEVLAAQDALTSAKIKADRLSNFKLPPVQKQEEVVQQQQYTPAPSADDKAVRWQQDNSWFGSDDEMTSFALGLHQKLVKQGVDPRSDEYYEKINSRMRTVFPEEFSFDEPEQVEDKPRKKANVVAPATRSTAPKKIVLTQTQVAIAKRLGVPLELYAQKVAEEMRKL